MVLPSPPRNNVDMYGVDRHKKVTMLAENSLANTRKVAMLFLMGGDCNYLKSMLFLSGIMK